MKNGGDQFEVRLGRIRSPSGHRRVAGFFKTVRRGGARISSGKRAYRQIRRTPSRTRAFQRRVLVKVHIQKMAGNGLRAQSLHLKYIERESAARDGEPGRLYNDVSDEVDRDAFEERGRDDRHQFRVIISPEDASELSNLRDYTRDVIREMERDLGTKLDWVAADHYDTGQPHTHLVIRGKRDDGHDLVIPKRYVAHGIRGRAQELAELELGSVTQLEGRTRLAHMVKQERLTEIDRGIFRQSHEGIVDFSGAAKRGQLWRRQLEKMRLQTLQKLGLAENIGGGQWRIGENAEATLKRMGERGDIIKAMHRAMKETGQPRLIDGAAMFDPSSASANPVTGKIIAKGIADDVNDHAFVVIDSLEGKAIYVDIGKADRLRDFRKDMIVTISPPNLAPRTSDRTIEKIANKNGGRYAPSLHMADDPNARPEFVEAHVRRLEALRRAGHVTRHSDGSWSLPPDYLERAGGYERDTVLARPVEMTARSQLGLGKMTSVMGATWLDEHLRDFDDAEAARGFGGEVEAARALRRNFLMKQGIIGKGVQRLDQSALNTLEARDLENAGRSLSGTFGKPYVPATRSGRISGVYTQAVDRPSGRFAVIERAKDFTLVPWRDVMDRNLGKSISGIVRGQQISWTLTRGRGISR